MSYSINKWAENELADFKNNKVVRFALHRAEREFWLQVAFDMRAAPPLRFSKRIRHEGRNSRTSGTAATSPKMMAVASGCCSPAPRLSPSASGLKVRMAISADIKIGRSRFLPAS